MLVAVSVLVSAFLSSWEDSFVNRFVAIAAFATSFNLGASFSLFELSPC